MSRRSPYALGGVFAMAAILLGAVLMWPIYASWHFWLMAGTTVGLGSALAALASVRGWSGPRLVLAGVGMFLALGVPLAVSSALTRWDTVGWGFVSLLRGAVQGWKQLVTIVLPVGNYQALMVPAFLTLLVSSLAAVWCAMRVDQWWALSIPLALLPSVFALAFGSSAVSAPIRLFGMLVPAWREVLFAVAAFAALMAMLRWRARMARRLRLGTRSSGSAAAASTVADGVRSVAARTGYRVRTAVLAVAMLSIAGTVALVLAPPLLGTTARQVVRSSVNPELAVQDLDSPLSLYRQWFDDSRFDQLLLSITGALGQGDRLRLAVLSHYDGRVFRTVNPALGSDSLTTVFRRLPYRLPGADLDRQQWAAVSIHGYDPVWMPTVGQVVSTEFSGPRGTAMADGFFYNEALEAGVQLLGFEPGDAYRIDYQEVDYGEVARFTRPDQPDSLIDAELVPDSLRRWVQRQGVGGDGAGLVQLVERLRERGYLSHSLLTAGQRDVQGAVVGDDAAEPEAVDSWVAALQAAEPGFVPRSSLAGHSMARIDQLFAELLLAEDEAGEQARPEQLVAAVGDDEQFAVAAALIARELGFPARVVLGFRLDEQVQLPITACTGGQCTGGQLTAWVEVQDAGGQWGMLDVTPQFALPISERVSERSDPKIPTETDQRAPEEQAPEGVTPGSGQEQEPSEAEGFDWLLVWRIVRWSGIGLLSVLLLLSPLLVVMVAKRLRARSRRQAATPAKQVVGAWDEYVDSAIDWGRPVPSLQTRREQALLLGTAGARQLADGADAAVFAAREPDAEQAEAYWRQVDRAVALLGRERSFWARLRARISLRSFTRYLPNWLQRSSHPPRSGSREK